MRIDHLAEPELEFGGGRHIDIRFGILNYGPLDLESDLAPRRIRLGVVGTPEDVERATDFRSVTWREGTKGRMTGRFAAWRVRPAHQLSAGKVPLAPCWLLAEWPAGADQPAKYFFSNLPPGTSLRRLVATAKSRWWVEHSYRELKDELGLDHFEGRSWRGWNHHVVLVLLAYAFLQDVLRRRPQKVTTS